MVCLSSGIHQSFLCGLCERQRLFKFFFLSPVSLEAAENAEKRKKGSDSARKNDLNLL